MVTRGAHLCRRRGYTYLIREARLIQGGHPLFISVS